MTLEDLRAARQLLIDNHPAATPEFRDESFQARLADFPRFETMALQVRTLGGYRAVLDRYAASFGDRHIARYPVVQPPARWPGFLVGRSGPRWIVRHGTESMPVGAELLECDGRSVDRLAEDNLQPYTPDWSLRAQRYRAAPDLFVSRDDPFIVRPRVCRFRLSDKSEREVTLDWRRISETDLAQELAAAGTERTIDNSIARLRNGWWLKLGTFQDEARPTVEQFVSMRSSLSGAPFIVIDLRGNAGGSSAYGEMVAQALYGSAAVAEARRRIDQNGDDDTVWRASPQNLQLLEEMKARFTEQLGADSSTTRYFVREAEAMRAALENGENFSQAADDPDPEDAGRDRADYSDPLAARPRIFLLTDFACFSACLETVQLFRELGAVQIGEDTDGGLNYFEVRAEPLPSGLALFSTLQSYSASRPLRLGPFEPVHRFEGDPADDAAIEAWVLSQVGASPGAP